MSSYHEALRAFRSATLSMNQSLNVNTLSHILPHHIAFAPRYDFSHFFLQQSELEHRQDLADTRRRQCLRAGTSVQGSEKLSDVRLNYLVLAPGLRSEFGFQLDGLPPCMPVGELLGAGVQQSGPRHERPMGVASLRGDEHLKPAQSYIGLIAQAILSSAHQRLVLSDIYQWIVDNHAYFRSRGPGWRNSVRHNLSLNDCFVKSARCASGKGHYWAIHPANVDDFRRGDFRRRRAQRQVRRAMGLSVPGDDEGGEGEGGSRMAVPCRRETGSYPSPSRETGVTNILCERKPGGLIEEAKKQREVGRVMSRDVMSRDMSWSRDRLET